MAAAAPGTDDIRPALPLDQVTDLQQASDRPTSTALSAPAVLAREHLVPATQPVSAAVAKQAADHATALPLKPDPKLNGYSAEVVVHHDRGSVITEQYRQIRTQILARARNRRLQTHVITSSAPNEGKTITSMNLGFVFSELRNHKTLLIECDIRRPNFERLLDRKCEAGLLQLLRGQTSEVDAAIQHTVYDNLDFIAAGGREPVHSTELLSSPRMAQVLDRLKDRYDHIFIDTPPVVTVTDASILGAMCDATMLVVRLNKTPAELIDRAKRLLRAANCEIAGVILTHLDQEPLRYLYRYAYGYAYGYNSYSYSKPKKK